MSLEATPKRTRASGGSSAAAGEPDRLSALPDCLLHSIMSFMKARQVVQTCVLSTRWKQLWRSAPCLDVDLDELMMANQGWVSDSDDDDYNYEVDDKDWEEFEDFTVNLMLCRNIALLDSFRLCVTDRAPHLSNKIAGAWVRRAIKYGTSDPCIQPREGLSSNSWRLKRLHLDNVFLDSLFAGHVTSACHSLEVLELKDCTCELRAITSHFLKNLVLKNCICRGLSDITSPTLKSLLIDGGQNPSKCLLVISAPSVVCLCLKVKWLCAGISINEMPSLDKASIHLRDKEFKFLSSVSNVRSLELSNLETLVLSEQSPAVKEFSNLRNLLLENSNLSDDFQTLTLFLQNSPRLEKLIPRSCKFSNTFKKKKGTPKPKKISSSQSCSLDVQCVNLKLTEIIYKDDDDVRQLVELLLPISGKLQKNHLKLTKLD